MSAPRVSSQQVKDALTQTGGNVKAAAERLGMRRNSLYERLEREQLDVAPLRARSAPLVRVLPDQAERIRRGRRRLAVALDADVDDTALLAQFLDERFDGWIEEKVQAAERKP